MPAFSVPANLAFDSYGDLKTAIEDWMNRSDLTGSVQAMIALAEARMRRELTPYFLEASSSVTSVDGLASLPADFGTPTRVMYGANTLPQYAVGSVSAVNPSYSEPLAYSIEQGKIRLWPNGNFTVSLLYQPKLTELSDANPTNSLLDSHPDIYFFGAMMFAEGYVANDERAATFKALFDQGLEEVKAYCIRQKFSGPLVPRVAFVP